jgi:hypothetical protein
MPFGFWGTAAESGVLESGGTLYYVLIVLAGLVPLLLLYRHKAEIRGMSAPQWAAVVVLSGAALLFGRLLPLSLPWSDPILSGQSVTSAMGPFAAAPYLLAGAALNVPAAIIVGLFSGLARAFGQTHSALDIVGVAWAAGLAALMVQQHYSGRFFRLLRRPPVAGALGAADFVHLYRTARTVQLDAVNQYNGRSGYGFGYQHGHSDTFTCRRIGRW